MKMIYICKKIICLCVLELLPNELFLNMLGCFTARELSCLFHSLNCRLKIIIDSISDLCHRITNNDYDYLNYLPACQITKLSIYRCKQINIHSHLTSSYLARYQLDRHERTKD